MKKVILLTAANDIHSARLANGLVSRGLEVHLVSVHIPFHQLNNKVKVHKLPVKAPFGYILSAPTLRKLLKKIKPDILNAHYATGYGLLARLSKFKPLLLSVWGTDVYDFPNKSFLHKKILKDNLKNATAIASTSNIMAFETDKTFKHQNVFITPFGIDETKFKKINIINNEHNKEILTIGTVKKLEKKYGIDILIRAFKIAHSTIYSSSEELANNLRLIIVGQGTQLKNLQKLTKELNINHLVNFKGFIDHEKVPYILNEMDIYAALSISESFGVAIIEANACGLPVVVSDADGLKEVTIDGKTAIVVPKQNVQKAAEALITLILDESLRKRLGKNGRNHVVSKYSWDKSLDIMVKAYEKTIDL